MKNLIILFISVLCVASAKGQQMVSISGIIGDSSANKIPYVAILLVKAGQSKAAISSDSGHYQLQIAPGRYLLKASGAGFKSYQDSVTINKDSTINIVLQAERKVLSEVNIVGQRPLIEQKIDRITFNVENSIFDKGVNALELLNQAPRVEVTPDGVINLIGKSNLAVMIDGRMIQSDQIRQRLSSLRSDNIARVDIITSPPAKYSAEGNSGIIDIILKKNPFVGWLFNFTSTYQQRTFAAGSQSANINYKSDKLDLNINASAFIEKKRFNTDAQYSSSGIYWDNVTVRDPFAKNISLNTSLNYKLGKSMNIGLLTDFSLEKDQETGQTNSTFQSINRVAVDSSIYSPALTKNHYNLKSVSVYYDYMLDSKGKKLSIIGNYFSKNIDYDKSIQSYISSNNSRIQELSNDANNDYQGTTVNADLDLPFTFARVETGGALLFINNHSLVNSFINFANAPFNDFAYVENTAALYLSLTKKFNKKWSAKAGLRYESTFINGDLITSNESNSTVLNNLFPSAYVSYNPTDKQTLTISYTRRIQKPSFSSLNPYRDYIDSYSYSTGNPFLLPAYSNNLEFTQTYNNNFTTTLSASALSNASGAITTFSPNSAATISMPENYYKQYSVGLFTSYTLSIKWFNSYNSFNLTYSKALTYKNVVDLPDQNGFWATYSMRNTLTLNAKKTAFGIINFNYVFPGTSGFYQLQSRSNVDLGARFQSSNKRVQYNIFLSDIFKQNVINSKLIYANAIQNVRVYNDLRYLNVAVSYGFGNNKVRANTKNADGTMKSRAL